MFITAVCGIFLIKLQWRKTKSLSRHVCRCAAIRTLSERSVRMAIHFFVNFDVFKSLYLNQNKLA